jgi:hypothetical protein
MLHLGGRDQIGGDERHNMLGPAGGQQWARQKVYMEDRAYHRTARSVPSM